MADGRAPISDELLALIEAEESRRDKHPPAILTGHEPAALVVDAPPLVADVVTLDTTKKPRKRKALPPADSIDDGLRPAWEIGLQRKPNSSQVTQAIANVDLILTEHDAWRGLFVHDSFAGKTLCIKSEDGRVPPEVETGPWTDVNSTRLRVWLSKNYEVEVGMDTIDLVVESIAKQQARHPIREYLESLKWDAELRIPVMFERYFGAPASVYHAEIARMWMISAVARIMQPGCQADYMIVLEGPQGTRKSTAIKILAKGWSADTIVDIGRPDAMQALRGVWIYEVAELASIRSAKDIEKVKGFITSRVDHYRKSYGRRTEDFPRQCVFAGSTNDKFYLNDPTGNRRYWPVPCLDIDTESLARDVDMLWAEAMSRYLSGESWYPQTADVARMCMDEQSARTQVDPWTPLVEQWIHKDPVWFHVGGESEAWVRVEDGSTTTDALRGAVSMPKDRISRQDETRMGRILRECGMVSRRPHGSGPRVRRYYLASDLVQPTERGPTRSNLDGQETGPEQEVFFGPDYLAGPTGPT